MCNFQLSCARINNIVYFMLIYCISEFNTNVIYVCVCMSKIMAIRHLRPNIILSQKKHYIEMN